MVSFLALMMLEEECLDKVAVAIKQSLLGSIILELVPAFQLAFVSTCNSLVYV